MNAQSGQTEAGPQRETIHFCGTVNLNEASQYYGDVMFAHLSEWAGARVLMDN